MPAKHLDAPMPQPEPPAELVEIAARTLAPFMEGGREFDQMPPDRIALRKWCREGMCSTNDATQDDALEAAAAVLAAVTPQIEARVTGEIVAWLQELATHTTKYSPTTIADNIESGHFAHWAETQRRGDHKESQP